MRTDILVPTARVFVVTLNRAYPHRGTGSDGSIASAEHTAGNPSSDHEPGPAGSPSPGLVDAVDVDADLVPGDQAASERAMDDVIRAFQEHPSTQYWIWQDRICHRSEGWQPRSYAYAGPHRNRHTKHAHFNWRETEQAHNDLTPYWIRGKENPVELDTKIGHKGWPNRSVRNFMLDLHGLRDALVGDAKATPIPAGSPLGRLLRLPAELESWLGRPVTLSPADREQITRDVTAAVLAALPEYGPRPNTP